MPNILKVTVENAGELLNAGAYDTGAKIRLQTSATETGVFADVSGTGSTPTIALADGTRIYTGYDPNGTSSSWYRTRYENAGGTRTSDWSAVFQVGDETAGLLCSLYDVKQRIGGLTATTSKDEDILDHIREVSSDVIEYTGRQLVPDPRSGTKTIRMHTSAGLSLFIAKGIRSITSLKVAVDDQPESGGTYVTASSSAYYLDPPPFERSEGWPATWVRFRRNASGAATRFYDAAYGVELDCALGWAAVPASIQGIAINAVVRRWQGRGSGTYAIATEEFAARLLRWISPEELETLDRYRVRLATAA